MSELIKHRTKWYGCNLNKETNMANTCLITAYIINRGEADNKAILDKLTSLADEANRNMEGFYAGSERYIFDARVKNHNGQAVILNGWVKWGYEDDEVKALMAFLKGIADYRSLILEYTTPDSEAHGKYIYDGTREKLVCVGLPSEFWPGDDYVRLCGAMGMHGVRREIPLN